MKRKAALGDDGDVPHKRGRQHFANDVYSDDNYGFTSEPESDYGSSIAVDNAPTPMTSRSGDSLARHKFPSEFKTIRCTFPGCTKAFNRPQRLANHLRSHTGERPFKCEFDGCDKTYQEEKHLRQHINATHTHEKKFECPHEGCSAKFPTASKLRRHEKVHEGKERFRCSGYPPCSQSFRKHQTLQRHIRSDHLHLPAYPCAQKDLKTNEPCEAAFKSPSALRLHIKQHHGEIRFWCEECGDDDGVDGHVGKIGFPTEELLRKHIEKSHFNCMFCRRVFPARSELEDHIESEHSGPKTVKKVACTWPGCNKSYSKNSNLQAHIRTAHEGCRFVCGQVDLTNMPEFASWPQSEGCGKSFGTKGNLEGHIRHMHMGIPRPQPTQKVAEVNDDENPRDMLAIVSAVGGTTRNTMSCTVLGCPQKFANLPGLKAHIQHHHGLDPDSIPSSMASSAIAPPHLLGGYNPAPSQAYEEREQENFNYDDAKPHASFDYTFDGMYGVVPGDLTGEWQNHDWHYNQEWQNLPEMGVGIQQPVGFGDIHGFIDPALETHDSNM